MGGSPLATLNYKTKRRSLVQFISCPRVARSYFLCDSISAAGTFTQDSLLLLPSHNTTCNFRECKNKKEKGLGLHQPAKCHYIVSDIHLYRWYSNRVFLFIIHLVHFANAKIKKRKDCGLASTAILNFWLCDRLMTLVH